jgi:hypothetical protein
MDRFASALIDALGGTAKVADLMHAPISTVHNMRTRRLTESRLNHLRRIAQDCAPPVDVAALASIHGVELRSIDAVPDQSSGKTLESSLRVSA